MSYTLSATVDLPHDAALRRTREVLAEQGFGILFEIDIRETLKAKLAVDVPAQVILGACRPPLAYAALQAEPSIGALLPCNVVVRSLGPSTSRVEAVDPQLMVSMTGNEAVAEIADEAGARLGRALTSIDPHSVSNDGSLDGRPSS
jgi:uncharacterized protein (DUF302 family)